MTPSEASFSPWMVRRSSINPHFLILLTILFFVKSIVAGHIAIDKIITNSGEAIRLGGPPSYIMAVSETLGIDVELITHIGPDFPLEYAERYTNWGVDLASSVVDEPTTSFMLDYTVSPRSMGLLSTCKPVTLPSHEIDSILLSPIAGEINTNQIKSLQSGFTAIDPQGMIRRTDILGPLRYRKWRPEGKLDLLKTSHWEHPYLTGSPDLETSLSLLAKNVGVAVITLGPDGSIARKDNTVYIVPSYPSNPVDTTGAGDCFLAGVSSELMKDEPVEWSLALGTAVSSCMVETKGTMFDTRSNEVFDRAQWVLERIEKSRV